MSVSMSPEEVERDLRFAIEAARVAGERVSALREAERWEGAMLADIGDQAADGYLQGLIAGRYPDDGILSEETRDSEARLAKERAWIIDPLDGTREYSQLREDWAVHVALTVGGRCALAAVGLPAQERLLWGVALEGRERAGIIGEGELARGDSPCADAPRIACSRSHTPAWMERFAETIGAGELIPSGSVGNKAGMLLLGVADVYVHRIGLKEWDTCAPETVARALGWTVSKLRGDEHAYNQPDPVNHEFVMCRPAWSERVVAALAACGALDTDD
ncbi:MAG: inositol monophosphatase family protein [Planctomycetota bacterium]|jgi:3'(2'), 5'-bisphosphate nucleotidase|nr:inositol monophosphatase family protein [Planctomycetota bacterium]